MRGFLGRLLALGFGAAILTIAGFFSEAPALSQSQDPGQGEISNSVLGNYLAARFARTFHDTRDAAGFYERAMKRDPSNELLIDQAFQMEMMSGDWSKAIPLAEKLVETKKSHRMAQFLLGLVAFKDADYKKAESHFKAASENPIGELTSAIALGWTRLAADDADGALRAVNLPKQPDWAQFYLRYHKALMADVAGRKSAAAAAFEKMFRQDSRTLRTSLAHAHHAAHFGEFKRARQIMNQQSSKTKGDPHPLVVDMLDRIKKRQKTPLIITTPAEGLAEVFYGLGEALTGEGGVSLGTIYLRVALDVKPDHAFALAALANAQEVAHQDQEAIQTYDRIPKGTPLQTAIEIRKAFNLNSLDKPEESKAILKALIEKNPKDIQPVEALGNICRARKEYADAVKYFTRAIALLGKTDKSDWNYFYARGTAYERLKDWPAAEADLKKALSMAPDQPMVLNYLGYSWIDRGKNLKQGMRLIEKAVQLKPDDGYIVDSLGWAHYMEGNYKEAVRFLERAVEIKPEDPTLNDHLGDAFWKVGREREARFQWDQALSLNPEPEDADKIKAKLKNGLDNKAEAKVRGKTRQVQRYETSRKRSENNRGGSSGRTVE
jgi:tetratricopeptide (TPR) repeat protein